MSTDSPIEQKVISGWVAKGSSILELGCGNGSLLSRLARERGVKVQGIEVDDANVFECVGRGLSVIHSTLEAALEEYPDGQFDYVILSGSMQRAVKQPDVVLKESLRVAGKVILSFSNFAQIRARSRIFFRGMAPITASLPYEWHDTPNLHFLSIKDFLSYCDEKGFKVEQQAFFAEERRIGFLPNLFALTGLFEISKER